MRTKGITLLELMVAVAILVIAVVGLLAALVNVIILAETNNNLVIATNDAQFILEQIMNLDTLLEIQNYTAPDLDNLGDDETITLNRTIGTNIAQVEVIIDWTERGRSRSFSLSSRFVK